MSRPDRVDVVFAGGKAKGGHCRAEHAAQVYSSTGMELAGANGSGLFANACKALRLLRASVSSAAMRCTMNEKGLQIWCHAG